MKLHENRNVSFFIEKVDMHSAMVGKPWSPAIGVAELESDYLTEGILADNTYAFIDAKFKDTAEMWDYYSHIHNKVHILSVEETIDILTYHTESM